MVPIIHMACDGQLAWYMRDEPRDPDIVLAKDWMRMDGSRPADGSVFGERCPCCGYFIVSLSETVRDFARPVPVVNQEEDF